MKTLAWILGPLALASSIALGADWIVVARGVTHATTERKKFAEKAANWQYAVDIERRNDRSRVENDRLQIRSDELDVQIAELSHRSTTGARVKLLRDQGLLRGDELIVRLDDDSASLGPDERVEAATERMQAAEASRAVYAGALARDHTMLYALGVLWLAFGFAAALAAGKIETPIAS